MPKLRIEPDLDMHYVVDDYTDPWTQPEAVLFIHGVFESGAVWFGWVPHLARRYRLIRPDVRGFGESTPMPQDYPWTMDGIVDDLVRLAEALGIERFHLVGAKAGATIATRFAASHPELISTLTLVGAPPPGRTTLDARALEWRTHIAEHGVESLARSTMLSRLGSRFPAAGLDWWAKLSGRTAASTLYSSILLLPRTDVTPDLPRIACPTLVITTNGSGLGSVEQTASWQRRIPRSRLVVLPGDSYHVAASDPDRCAEEMWRFLSSSTDA